MCSYSFLERNNVCMDSCVSNLIFMIFEMWLYQDNYAFVQDLQWYISILIDLSFVSRVSKDNARLLADQLLDVAIRVPAVRPFAVKAMVCLNDVDSLDLNLSTF